MKSKHSINKYNNAILTFIITAKSPKFIGSNSKQTPRSKRCLIRKSIPRCLRLIFEFLSLLNLLFGKVLRIQWIHVVTESIYLISEPESVVCEVERMSNQRYVLFERIELTQTQAHTINKTTTTTNNELQLHSNTHYNQQQTDTYSLITNNPKLQRSSTSPIILTPQIINHINRLHSNRPRLFHNSNRQMMIPSRT